MNEMSLNMSWGLKIGLLSGAIVSLLVVGAGFAVTSFSLAGDCGNEMISETLSPDKSLKVVLFQRDCGATTGFSTQVTVLPAAQSLPNDSGNVLVADTDHGKAPSGPGGGPEVQTEWKSDRELIVRYHPAARTFGLPSGQSRKVAISNGWFRRIELAVRYEQLAR